MRKNLGILLFTTLLAFCFQREVFADTSWAKSASTEGPVFMGVSKDSFSTSKDGWTFGAAQADGDFLGTDAEGTPILDQKRSDLVHSGGGTDIGINYRHSFRDGISADFNISHSDDTAVMVRFSKSFSIK